MSKNDGGPAFPTDSDQQVAPNTWHFSGMTLRDWFAGMALQGFITSKADESMRGYEMWREEMAKDAYRYADAMLAERQK